MASTVGVYAVLDEEGELLREYDDAYWALRHAQQRSDRKRVPVTLVVESREDESA